MYSLIYSDLALQQLKKLDRQIQVRILSTLERCQIRPYAHLKKLVGNPYFRLRVGDYRVIIDVQENQFKILVLEVGHRRNIYQ